MRPIGLVLICATVAYPGYQLLALPGITDQVALFSQYMGLAALVLMSWGQLLATRMRGVEQLFGGLDRVYVLHKWAGIAAMAAILLHDLIGAEMRGLGAETTLNDIAESLGEISFYGLIFLVLISVATFIPYHLWKWTHKAMGALFAIGSLHFFLIAKPFPMTDFAGLYTGLFCVAGIASYLWMLLPQNLRPTHRYKVSNIEATGGALAIKLEPVSKGLNPSPGQFGVLRFSGAGLREPHPFSFSKIDPDRVLRVTVKALGDYTSKLTSELEDGQLVRVQGPFGRFRQSGRGRQVWVAGGIGITPFLAWADALSVDGEPVDLFYCMRSRKDAPHLEEVEKLAQTKSNLSLHLMVSQENRRISAEHISDVIGPDLSRVTFSFCGPVSLRLSLKQGLRRYGVSARRFRYEEFEFRTGIGVRQFFNWLLRRKFFKFNRIRILQP
ncbi:ferric reductase-like transmembrane domain-containing protein [Ruegeria sp. EL01]|uniref:ferredoxin reductase family protein n=1 Tax=Ruegeria sp. EL01 TaxID=2107578 RepID=UPI000EA7F1CC|nr:ferric reductase-like transmembrane domain-containing protein [Ruegeria sp. EL01]